MVQTHTIKTVFQCIATLNFMRLDRGGQHIAHQKRRLIFAQILAREIIGNGKIIGVSCYGDLERAKGAIKKGADYVAFGSFFPSPTKPHAKVVDKSVLSEAKSLGVPVCAIGGIGINNGGELVTAGADMLSVISALWVGDIYQNASRFSSFYKNLS